MLRVTEQKRKSLYWKLFFMLLLVLPMLMLISNVSYALEKTFQYSADVTIVERNRNGTFGKSDICQVSGSRSSAGERSTLMMWNISSLPKNSRITGATINLHITNNSADTFYVYGLRKRWAEYEATWEKASKSTWWSKPGASGYSDRHDDPAGYLLAKSGSVASIRLDPDLVQDWLEDSQGNYGIVIAAARVYDDDDVSFYCSESTRSSYRPELIIKYVR